MTRLVLKHREPFALTAEQIAWLAAMKPAARDHHLGILAQAHEWEMRRRDYHAGAPFLMPQHVELQFAREWPAMRDAKLGEARAAFEAVTVRVAA